MFWRFLFLIPLLTGCGGSEPAAGYEPTAIYPPRTDVLVLALDKVPPPANADASARGKLDESIADLGPRGAVLVSPASLTPLQQSAITESLHVLFGTPAAPRVEHPDAARYGLTPEKLAAGSKVYKAHCVQCHGMSGDGRGPTSLWVYPHARDFRQGQFKFISTSGPGWPTRNDIHRAVRRGVSGASMPPFNLLSDDAIDDVTSYTLHLMLRGRVEFDLIRFCEDDLPGDLYTDGAAHLVKHFSAWSNAQATELALAYTPIIEPRIADTDASYSDQVRRGHDLFNGKAAGCVSCHADYGRASQYRYDVWGIAVKPAALTTGKPSGGGESLDYIRRIKCGIPGSGMPATSLGDNDIFDLVLFLRALPDPRHLPADVRKAVYPEVK